MKILSFNCRGLASPHEKTSLKHLVLQIGPNVLFLKETLGSSEEVKEALQSLLPGWEFMTMDAKGQSGGMATGLHYDSCHFSNSWGCDSFLGMEVYSQELNSFLCLVNLYGPYQDRVVF